MIQQFRVPDIGKEFTAPGEVFSFLETGIGDNFELSLFFKHPSRSDASYIVVCTLEEHWPEYTRCIGSIRRRSDSVVLHLLSTDPEPHSTACDYGIHNLITYRGGQKCLTCGLVVSSKRAENE